MEIVEMLHGYHKPFFTDALIKIDGDVRYANLYVIGSSFFAHVHSESACHAPADAILMEVQEYDFNPHAYPNTEIHNATLAPEVDAEIKRLLEEFRLKSYREGLVRSRYGAPAMALTIAGLSDEDAAIFIQTRNQRPLMRDVAKYFSDKGRPGLGALLMKAADELDL